METIEIYGRVKDGSGAPVEKANISLMIGNEVLNNCISDSEGKFDHKVIKDPHFLGSELTYIVKKEGYRPETKSIKIEGTKVVLGDIELTKDIQSSPFIIISGNIKDAGGRSIADANVSFFVGSGEPVILRTDAKGEFRHEAKKEQAGMELKYKAEKEGYKPKEGSVKVQEAGTTLAITMDPIPPTPPEKPVEKKPDDKKPTNLILAGVALAVILIIAAWLLWPKGVVTIDQFGASSQIIGLGEGSRLTWATTNADNVSINGENVNLSGNIQVNPTKNTTYTLVAQKGKEKAEEKLDVIVKKIDPPETKTTRIENFEADPSAIMSGESSTLKWIVSNADRVSIDPKPAKTPQETSSGDKRIGQVSVNPQEITTYTLTAWNETDKEAAATKTVRINVTVKRPAKIESFEADPSAITSGESSTLRWSVSNADRVSIDPKPAEALRGTSDGDKGIGDVTVNPQKNTTYTLTAWNQDDKEAAATKSVRINVRQEPVIEPTMSITFDAFPDGTPITNDVILKGDEFSAKGVLLRGLPESSYCDNANAVAIHGPESMYNIDFNYLSSSDPQDINRCNTVPVAITFFKPVREVVLTFAGASVTYTMKAYDDSNRLLGTVTEDAINGLGTFEIKYSNADPIIKYVTFGKETAGTMIKEIYYER